ncbi:MAG: hypothetical protein JWP35_966 [Caulobacter sp.]|nr:hypothetical protein [Caulobacter sp.]
MAELISSPIEPRQAGPAKDRWTWRDIPGTLFALAFMAALLWSIGVGDTLDPHAERLRTVLSGILFAGLAVRALADRLLHHRAPKVPRPAAPLYAVTDGPATPAEIPRPRLDAALNALAFAIWLFVPLWRLPHLAAAHDWPKFTVLAGLLVWMVFGILRNLWRWLQRTEDAVPA